MDAELLRVVLGVNGGEILGDDGEVGLSLADGDARLEVAQQETEHGEAVALHGGGTTGLGRNPHIGVAPTKARGHYADEGALRAVEDKGLVDEFGIGAEAGDPGLVAHDEDGRGAGLVISGLRYAAEVGGHAQEFKGAGGDEVAVEALGAFA